MNQPLRCVVIGGSGELGRAICRALLAAGAAVGMSYFRNENVANELRHDFPQLVSKQLDLRDLGSLPTKLKELTDQLGGCNVMIHCAAVCLSPGDPVPPTVPQQIGDVSTSGWDELMRVNLDSVFFSCQQVIPTLRACGGGNVVLVGSVSGTRPLPSPIHYATSRTALEGMARAMAKEFGGDNIRVNVIEPGLLERGISRSLPQSLRDQYLKHCALRRLGTMQEIAEVVCWFALENSYVTGQAILVDGAL